MTVIATAIGKYGIIQASDANVPGASGQAGNGRSIFHLGFTHAALALAGASSVGGEGMDTWMPACITSYETLPQPSLAGFAHHLAGRLSDEMRDGEWQGGGVIRIGGYVPHSPGVHPEVWFVRNTTELDATGERTAAGRRWDVSEDFWARDYRKIGTRIALASGLSYHYFSGVTPAGAALVGVGQLLNDFFQQAWQNQAWGFREPRTLDELAPIVELSIRAIGTLCRCSDYPAPPIGGDVQVEKLIPPHDAVEL